MEWSTTDDVMARTSLGDADVVENAKDILQGNGSLLGLLLDYLLQSGMVRGDVAEIAACKKSELRTIQFKLQKSGRFGGEGREEQLNNASSNGMYGQLWNLALERLLVRWHCARKHT